MRHQTIEAVYEHGAFRLIQPSTIPLAEGQRVRIVVETEYPADDVLALATSVFDGLTDEDIQEITAIAHERESFFADRS